MTPWDYLFNVKDDGLRREYSLTYLLNTECVSLQNPFLFQQPNLVESYSVSCIEFPSVTTQYLSSRLHWEPDGGQVSDHVPNGVHAFQGVMFRSTQNDIFSSTSSTPYISTIGDPTAPFLMSALRKGPSLSLWFRSCFLSTEAQPNMEWQERTQLCNCKSLYYPEKKVKWVVSVTRSSDLLQPGSRPETWILFLDSKGLTHLLSTL